MGVCPLNPTTVNTYRGGLSYLSAQTYPSGSAYDPCDVVKLRSFNHLIRHTIQDAMEDFEQLEGVSVNMHAMRT